MPQSAEGYVHHIGRTERAYSTGASLSLWWMCSANNCLFSSSYMNIELSQPIMSCIADMGSNVQGFRYEMKGSSDRHHDTSFAAGHPGFPMGCLFCCWGQFRLSPLQLAGVSSTDLVLESPPPPPLTTTNNHQLPPPPVPTASVATANHQLDMYIHFENCTTQLAIKWNQLNLMQFLKVYEVLTVFFRFLFNAPDYAGQSDVD
ncbi:hypothetical protein RHGRI_009315 [Rhododendron griersonianum]|uniref:Uncharacterized protein n=1 Tax=Rhododendron griersonianum TaxID=479676 RepID=A0AAV6L4D0_9ERIC|nr:hypothetical protein RHGRI_009315 [Rhododendron griersonianum]